MTILPRNLRETDTIGHYQIRDCIGRGGMGLVYLAFDTRLHRQVAIKVLHTELHEKNYRERFKREALLLAKLNHPNIVQIYDFIEGDDQLALVMEYVDGQNLQQRLREQIVSFAQRMQWLTQIAHGLAVAHDAGIIHRDLKAENILINKRNDAKISDLGIAKFQDNNATVTDHVAGSYCSMSPEQAVGEELDFKSDLFSLGILAYQLLCGAHPFGDTSNKLQVMQRIISHPPISPLKNNPDLPPEICDLLGQLLSKNPENRPANTHWVAAQFEKFKSTVLTSASISDDTQQLHNSAGEITKNHTINSLRSTQEHPTFEMRAYKKPISFFTKIKNSIVNYRAALLTVAVFVFFVGSAVAWYLQPKEPHYVAVLLPAISASGMQESQQELVKSAVYDAIQQSVLQIDGYYLIPRSEIADINSDNTRDTIESVRIATAADELITTDIQCKIEACTITLSRLTPENYKKESRLRVKDTKTVDVLTDNYLSVATIVQNNIGSLYAENVNNAFERIEEQDYADFLRINNLYKEQGASKELLENLNRLNEDAKNISLIQTIYTEISLDLYSTSKDKSYLERLEGYLSQRVKSNNEISYLYNLYYLQIAKNDILAADNTIAKLKKLKASSSVINELYAYKMMAEKNYQAAIEFYKKAIESRTSANNLFLIAKAYWYAGNTNEAKTFLNKSLGLSPNNYKSRNLLGLIALVDGDAKSAAEAFENTVKQKPDEIADISNLGLSYLLLGKYGLASELFDRAYRLAPQFDTLLLNKADAESLAGNSSEAKMMYQKIVSEARKSNLSNESLRSLSQAQAHLGNFFEALTALQQLEKLDPQNIETIYTAALVHTLAKNNVSAILNVENALKNGMNKIWFSFSWFDSLCVDNKFIVLMEGVGESDRCPLQK